MKYRFLLGVFLLAKLLVTAQVNLHNGTPEANMPIFSFSDNNNKVSTSISLDYIGGNGIKVNDIASDVGLGWKLNAGGVIIRKQNGEPDDQKCTSPKTYVPWKDYYSQGFWASPPPGSTEVGTLEQLDYYIFGDGYLFNNIDPTTPVNSNAAYVPGYDKQQGYGIHEVGFKPTQDILADREQDEFLFSFNGRAGSFIFSKNGTIRTLEDSRLKITCTFVDMSFDKIRTRIKSFTIIDEAGIKYVFNDNSLEQLCTYKRTKSTAYESNGEIIPSQDQATASGDLPHIDSYEATPIDQYTISKWYLSDIINPITLKSIHFEYDTYPVDYIADKNLTLIQPDNTAFYRNRISITNVRTICTDKRLKKIYLPDDAFVDLEYNTNERNDLLHSNSLKKVSVTNGDYKESHEFEYGYFFKKEIKSEDFAFSSSEKKFTRLCLKSIRKSVGPEQEEPFQFEYFTGAGSGNPDDYVPPRLIFPTDNFGYYNGFGSQTEAQVEDNYIFPNFNPLFYQFNLNDYTRDKGYNSNNGLLKKIINPYKGSLEFEFERNTSTTGIDYGGVRVSKVINYDGLDHNKDLIQEYKYINSDGTCSWWGNDPQLNNSFTTYVKQYKATTSVPIEIGKMTKAFSNKLLFGSGMVYYALGQIRPVKKYVESEIKDIPPYVYNYAIGWVINHIGYIFAPDYTLRTYINKGYYPLSFQNPLPAQFSRVEVFNGSGSLNSGKTVFEFTSDQDYPIDVPTYDFPFSDEQRCFTQAYGLPKKTTFYNATNQKIKGIENQYSLKKIILSQSDFGSQNWKTITAYTTRYQDASLYLNNLPTDVVTSKNYYPITGRVELIKNIESLYNNAGDKISTTKDYTYNPINFLPASVVTTDSKDRTITSNTYYPEDYTLPYFPVLQGLVTANIVNIPVSSETWQTKGNGLPEMLSSSITEFGTAPNGDYKTIKTFGLQTDKPVPQSTIGAFNPGLMIRNTGLIKPEGEITYNGNGNPVETKDLAGNRKTATLYYYNHTLPVAFVTNAGFNEVAYTSFEKGFGGYIPDANCGLVTDNKWEASNTVVFSVDDPSAPTGKSCAQLNLGGTIRIGDCNFLPITKDYRLTLWANAASFSVSGLSPNFSGPTINGWTYYEYDLPSGSTLPVITGTCRIDELRIYPKDANMVTTTYEPGLGKTSECDINNRITYYEYDGLGRISKIFDDHHNIIKTYEYHYRTN